jgi:hypothetical protein
VRRLDAGVGVDRAKLDPAVGPGLDDGVRAKADGGIQRAGAGMKQVEGPDVDGAAGEIDTRGRRGLDGSEAAI